MLDRMTVQTKLWVLAGSLMAITIILWWAGYWLAARQTAQSNALTTTILAVAQASDTTRQAQADFKGQVQEWKDILVRGHDPANMTKYREAFDKSTRRSRTTSSPWGANWKPLRSAPPRLPRP